MSIKVKARCWVVLLAVLGMSSPAGAFVIIHEVLSDPPAGLAGDANGDQVGSSSQDEFVELFNGGAAAVDLSGWTLADNTKVRHIFPEGSLILPNSVFVIFGGGSPVFDSFSWQVASSGGLGLNNTGDFLLLADAYGIMVDYMEYGPEANADQSLTRFPEGSPSAGFIQHTKLPGAESLRFSPGYLVTSSDRNAVIPEPLSIWGLSLGLMSAAVIRRKRAREF